MRYYTLKKIIQWALFIVSVLIVLSGFGISNYQIVEKLTFGLLTKSLSFRMHAFLAWPFVILFILHVFVSIRIFRRKK